MNNKISEKQSEKIEGDIKGKFKVSLDRDKDDYLLLLFDDKMKTNNYYMSSDVEKLVNMLLTLYFIGNSSVKAILGNFISNVTIMQTQQNFEQEKEKEIQEEINLNDLKVN